MRIVTSQNNFTVGALEENANKIAAVVRANLDADWVVFTELALTGYYPGDLINVSGFYENQEKAMEIILQASRETNAKIVFGAITPNQGKGKKWHNSLVIVQNGSVALTYDKQLLPTYDVFDEFRHFEPGEKRQAVWREDGKPTVGLIVCEDGWNDEGQAYEANPTKAMSYENIDLLISINASPAAQKKTQEREQMVLEMAKKYGWSVLYVNQVGANDAIVFDGNSFACRPDGSYAYHAKAFEEETQVLVYDEKTKRFADSTIVVPEEGEASWYTMATLGVRDYFRKNGNGFKTALIGSSGGIDSAVVECIAADALGAENVIALTMPSDWSSEGSVSDSVTLAKNLGIALHEVPIKAAIGALQETLPATTLNSPLKGVALENAQARMRGLILMCWANQVGGLLLTTGNKSEMSVGYATLYGDMSGALNPLGDLYKMEVYALARWINKQAGYARIPQAIIDKAPSAELAPGQKDEDSLPPYPVLDTMLKLDIEGHLLSEVERKSMERSLEGWEDQRKDVRRKMEMAEFKRRQAPPIIRIHPRAFGAGWQFPVAQQYKGWTR